MANNAEWITDAIDRARQQAKNAPEALWTELASLLNEKLARKPLPARELAAIAVQLIDATNPAEVIAEKP